MTWVKIDDNFPQNLKIRSVPVAARWAYLSSICYAGNNRTDGRIPRSALALLDATPAIAEKLVAVGLWEPYEAGWLIHDFLKHNRSKERAEAVAETRAQAGSKGAAKRWQVATSSDGKTDGNLFLSASVSSSPSEEDPGKSTDTDRQTDSKLPSRHKPIDESYLQDLDLEFPTVNVRGVLERAQNRKNWDGYKDKRRALRDHIGYELERQRTNGRSKHSEPDEDDPILRRLRLDAEREGRAGSLPGLS